MAKRPPKRGTKATPPKAVKPTYTPDQIASRPQGWGADGVVGGWQKAPNLDANLWEIGTNVAGRYFARPITELTGLTAPQRQAIAAYDKRAAAQMAQYDAIGNQAYNDTKARADNLTQQLRDIAALSGNQQTSQAAPGIQAGGGQTQTMVNAAGVQQQTAHSEAAQAVARQAATFAAQRALNAPQNARDTVSNAATQYRMKSDASRGQMVTSLQNAVLSAKAAKDKATADLYNNQARVIAAAIAAGAKLSAEEMAQLGANARAQLQSDTTIAANNADNATTGATGAASSNDKVRAQRKKDTAAFVDEVPGLLSGKREIKDQPGGVTVTQKRPKLSPMAVLQQGLARGIPAGPIIATIVAQNPRDTSSAILMWKNNRQKALEVAQVLLRNGVGPVAARKVIARYMNVDVGPYANGKGPGGTSWIP